MGLPIGMALFGLAVGASVAVAASPTWSTSRAGRPCSGPWSGSASASTTRSSSSPGTASSWPRGMTVEESVGRAVATAGQSVIFAGGTVVVADPRARRRRHPVHDRRQASPSRAHRAVDGARLDHPAARRSSGWPGTGSTASRRRRERAQPTGPSRLAPVGRARGPPRAAYARRGHGPPARPGRTGARAAAGLPRRGDDARQSRPSAGPTTWWPTASVPEPTARWSSPSTSRGDPGVVAPLAAAVAADPGIAAVGARGVERRRRGRDLRRHPDHVAPGRGHPARPSSGSARRSSRPCSTAARLTRPRRRSDRDLRRPR